MIGVAQRVAQAGFPIDRGGSLDWERSSGGLGAEFVGGAGDCDSARAAGHRSDGAARDRAPGAARRIAVCRACRAASWTSTPLCSGSSDAAIQIDCRSLDARVRRACRGTCDHRGELDGEARTGHLGLSGTGGGMPPSRGGDQSISNRSEEPARRISPIFRNSGQHPAGSPPPRAACYLDSQRVLDLADAARRTTWTRWAGSSSLHIAACNTTTKSPAKKSIFW